MKKEFLYLLNFVFFGCLSLGICSMEEVEKKSTKIIDFLKKYQLEAEQKKVDAQIKREGKKYHSYLNKYDKIRQYKDSDVWYLYNQKLNEEPLIIIRYPKLMIRYHHASYLANDVVIVVNRKTKKQVYLDYGVYAAAFTGPERNIVLIYNNDKRKLINKNGKVICNLD